MNTFISATKLTKNHYEESLSAKEEFFSGLNNKEISDQGYGHPKRGWNGFSIKNLGEDQDSYSRQISIIDCCYRLYACTVCMENYSKKMN